jgi:hypothetical protein
MGSLRNGTSYLYARRRALRAALAIENLRILQNGVDRQAASGTMDMVSCFSGLSHRGYDMSRFFKATFSINIAEHLPSEYTFKIGHDPDSGQEFITGNSERFLQIVKFLSSKNIVEFDKIEFCHWHDGGDDATLEMFHNWETGLKKWMYRPKRVGIHYVYNHEPFDTLYHACEYAKQCDSEISDDTAELNHVVDQTFREFCENGNIWNQ